MDRNLKRVHRWIDRCMAACGSQKWDSALAEVECARAELESARETIWERASGSPRQFPVGQFFSLSFRSLSVAILLVMAAALPISTGGYAPMGVERISSLRLEWVTTDEQSVLKALRNSLSEMNFARNTEAPEAVVRPKNTVFSGAVRQEPLKSEAVNPGNPTLEEILALIEIGQRELRGEGVIIQRLK